MAGFIYMAGHFAGLAIYMMIGIYICYTAVRYPFKIKTLGLTLLACILSLLIFVEIPKAFITNKIPEAKGAEQHFQWKWTSEVNVEKFSSVFEWWADACTKLATNMMILLGSATLVIIWIIRTQHLEKMWGAPYTKISFPKWSWKVYSVVIASTLVVLAVGWFLLPFLFIVAIWISRPFVKLILGLK